MAKTVTLTAKDKKDKKGAKKPKYELVPEDDPAWRLLGEVRKASHSTLEEAKIVLAWEHNVKVDRDGHVVLGKAKKVGPLDRMFRDQDFTICLNSQTWGSFGEAIKRAILDHELCHCGVMTNAAGETKFYIRKHDLEDFVEVVARHGIWRGEIQKFIDAALGHDQTRLFDEVRGFTSETRKKVIDAIKAVNVEKLRESERAS